MFGPRVRIWPELWQKLQARAEALGYASVQEFITHVLEREAERAPEQEAEEAEEEEIRRQNLEGLGYLA